MNILLEPNLRISGTNENGTFEIAVEKVFRSSSMGGNPIAVGTVTVGKIWPKNKVDISFPGTNQTLACTAREIQKNGTTVKVAVENESIGILIGGTKFHKIREYNKTKRN
ncbi:MAG: hypothetical protein KBC17_01775 [Candidatus Pacebacteria bacterium]|nr:hypothetical protein [Candidatus Paceibacterota bacterium]